MTALMHVKGWGAPEAKAAAERARLLIEQAEGLGEPLDDPLLLFSMRASLWNCTYGLRMNVCSSASNICINAAKLPTQKLWRTDVTLEGFRHPHPR